MESNHWLSDADNLALAQKHPLLQGLSTQELITFFSCVETEYREIEPGQRFTIEPGNRHKLGIIIEGDVKVLTVDYGGNKTIINIMRNFGSVGTMQFMADYYNMLYEVVADTPAKLVMGNPDDLLVTREGIASIQHRILANLLISQRQLFLSLSNHLVCLSQKNIRDKVLRYLQLCSEKEQAYEFDVPLSREDMAVYLAVDRASLSRSLSELRREGVLEFRKNHFKILSTKFFSY